MLSASYCVFYNYIKHICGHCFDMQIQVTPRVLCTLSTKKNSQMLSTSLMVYLTYKITCHCFDQITVRVGFHRPWPPRIKMGPHFWARSQLGRRSVHKNAQQRASLITNCGRRKSQMRSPMDRRSPQVTCGDPWRSAVTLGLDLRIKFCESQVARDVIAGHLRSIVA